MRPGAALILIALAFAQPASAQTRLALTGRFELQRLELVVVGETSFAAMENDCTGHVTRAPAVVLTYDPGPTPPRALEIRLTSETDTVLAVFTPGEPEDAASGHPRHCSDDEGGGVNPALRIEDLRAGDYRIHPGVFAEGETAHVVLTVQAVD